MRQAATSRWKAKRTAETRAVEYSLRQVFPNTDAYGDPGGNHEFNDIGTNAGSNELAPVIEKLIAKRGLIALPDSVARSAKRH
jgi:hypothetical protein